MPEGLRFLRFDPAVWLPFQFDRAEVYVGNFSYQALARLKPGVTLEAANTDVGRLLPMTVEKFPKGMSLAEMQDAQFGPNVRPLKRDVVGDVGKRSLGIARHRRIGAPHRVRQRREPFSRAR